MGRFLRLVDVDLVGGDPSKLVDLLEVIGADQADDAAGARECEGALGVVGDGSELELLVEAEESIPSVADPRDVFALGQGLVEVDDPSVGHGPGEVSHVADGGSALAAPAGAADGDEGTGVFDTCPGLGVNVVK